MRNADSHDDAANEPPSRSGRRREALAMLDLAEALVTLPPSRVKKIDVPDEVREEIANVRRIPSHIARKRQLAHLAKLMRRHDQATFDAARAELANERGHGAREATVLHRLEALRENLLAGGDEVLAGFIAAHPDVDRQRLRSLIRQARGERDGNKPLHAYRELFRLLRELGSVHTTTA
ncbi:MAG: ribosome biogenesis factor YjgA [Rhodanobacteraceae bacterium]